MDSKTSRFFEAFIIETVNLKALTADYNSFFINMSLGTENIKDNQELQKEITNRFKNLDLGQTTALINLLNMLRRTALSLITDLNSLQKYLKLSQEKIKVIQENYQEIEEVSLPDYKKCKAFMQALNDIKTEYINVEAMLLTEEKTDKAIESSKTPKGVTLDQ